MSTSALKIGNNHPPSPVEYAKSVIDDINVFLTDHPTIQSEDDARAAKPHLDRAKAAFEDIERERDGLVRPLNEKVAGINSEYKGFHNTDAKKPGAFDRILIELKARVSAFLIREEERKRREAEEAQRKLEEAERIAREAEAKEQEALSNAKQGEIVDIASVTQDADTAFAEFEKQSRFTARAERDTKVKVGGGFGRAASLRDTETLHLEHYGRALKAIGPHPKIEEGILAAAREYRRTHDELPDGVTATYERKL